MHLLISFVWITYKNEKSWSLSTSTKNLWKYFNRPYCFYNNKDNNDEKKSNLLVIMHDSDHSNTYILSLISLKIKINNSINLKEQSCMLLPNVLDAIPIFASNAFKNISPALHVCTKNFILLNSNYIPLNSIL